MYYIPKFDICQLALYSAIPAGKKSFSMGLTLKAACHSTSPHAKVKDATNAKLM
jgi:hypothetical protein